MLSAFILQTAKFRLYPTPTLALAQCRSLSALPCPDPTHTDESLPEGDQHSSGRCADVSESQSVSVAEFGAPGMCPHISRSILVMARKSAC